MPTTRRVSVLYAIQVLSQGALAVHHEDGSSSQSERARPPTGAGVRARRISSIVDTVKDGIKMTAAEITPPAIDLGRV